MRYLILKVVCMSVLLLIPYVGFASGKYDRVDPLGPKVGKRDFSLCQLPTVGDEVINRVINKFNAQDISCDKKGKSSVHGGFSINGKPVNIPVFEMVELIRNTVFSCQDYTDRSSFFKTKRNQCVRNVESDVDYFLNMTKDPRIKSFASPYDIVVSRTQMGGQYTNFKRWANLALRAR